MLPRVPRTFASACLVAAVTTAFLTPQSHAAYVIDSLTGDVTQNEVDSYISTIQAVTIPTSQWSYNGNTTLHNYLADGAGGCDLRSINLMYQICQANPNFATEQMQLINLAIQWNEAWLTHRNDLPLGDGRVMWTGNVDKVWAPQPPTSTDPTYAACEVGDTVGILAETALNILNTPSIWSQTVPDGNPNGYGTTYLQRAQTYTQMLEESMDEFFTPYFLNTSTAYIQAPTSSAWTNLNPSQNVNAWNRGFMFTHAYQVLSQIHTLLNDNATKASLYKQVTLNWANLYVKNAVASTAVDGTPDFNWGYGNYGDVTNKLTGESTSHGGFDTMGITRAYRTPGFTSTVTNTAMELYAATLFHEIRESAQVYATYVDQSQSNATSSSLPQEWFYLVPYNPSMFTTLATDAINSNRINGSQGALYTALILWDKHTIATTTNAAVNDTDSGISYSGTWSYSSNRNLGDYQNDVHYTRTAGNSFSYTFNGTGIDYVTETNSDEGSVTIYLDGVQQTTVSCYSASRQVQVPVYSANGLIAGTHTLKAVMSSGTYMLLDELVVHELPGTTYTITASAGTGGTINPSGGVSVAQGANQTFAITANSGYTISAVTVDGANVGAVSSYTFGNVQANHTISASFSGSISDTNIAPNGTAYGWNANTSSTANTNKSAQPGLNDNNLTNNVDIDSAGDAVGAWEAAGVTWTSTKTISSAKFINGDVTSGGDGFLTANLQLQFSTDGSTWTNSGWTVSPAYPYSSSAGGQTYTFSGTAVSGVLGARVVGQVRTTDTSYHWIVKEVQFIGH